MALCLENYKDTTTFIHSFSSSQLETYLDRGRDKMITTDVAPTLLVAKKTFGSASVMTIIKDHLFSIVKAFGVVSSEEAVDEIASDIISGYSYLKITEVILALKMMREGKFKNGDANMARMYGTLSSSVICECLNRFCSDYRDRVLTEASNEEIRKNRELAEKRKATPSGIRSAVYLACLEDISQTKFYKFLTHEEIMTLEYYAAERKALVLLKQRVEEFLASNDKNTESLSKGVEYINKNFPFEPKDIVIFEKKE